MSYPSLNISMVQQSDFKSFLQDLRKSVGRVQSTLVMKLSTLDKYEHVLSQVNAVAMEKLIDPQTQVSTRIPLYIVLPLITQPTWSEYCIR